MRTALSLAILLGAAPLRAAERLSVAVAASVSPALAEVAAAFAEETGVAVALTPGSSGKLAAQIRSGAPFDVLVSADMLFPGAKAYASGRLILWTLKGVEPRLDVLSSSAVVKIAVADPKTAPYGRAALQALAGLGVEAKLVYGESVAQVNQFVASKAADIGLTAKSTAFAPATKGLGRWSEVPPALYDPLEHGAAAVKAGPAAERFVAFLSGKKARAILRRHGFD